MTFELTENPVPQPARVNEATAEHASAKSVEENRCLKFELCTASPPFYIEGRCKWKASRRVSDVSLIYHKLDSDSAVYKSAKVCDREG